jgi:diguanylate cyclase (GGDEF)-like protein
MKRKMLSKSEFITLLSFAFPALLGGMIRSLFFGVSILWKSVSVSILIIFIKLQNFDMYMDHLTGLWNRRKLQQFFDNFSHDTFKNQMMGGIMIDVDHFKMINHRHGHIVGDKVLSEVAQILKQTFNKEDFVCRYGGDEFVVILYIKNQNDLESCIVRLKKNLDKFNVMSQHPFDVNLSVGYDIVNLSLQTQSEIYLSSLDKKMYENKLRHRQSAQDHSVYF